MARAYLCWITGWCLMAGCVGTYEDAVRRDLSAQRRTREPRPTVESAGGGSTGNPPVPPTQPSETSARDGEVMGYVTTALAESPAVQAEFSRWRASVEQIAGARRLPELTLTFGYFIRSVETRVGPQRARLGLQQAFPWPTALSAGVDAASARARAAQRRFEARVLEVARRVREAYWDLWQLRRTRAIHHEHLQVLQSLSETVAARMATGAATLADRQQVDLTAARLEDALRGMDEQERALEARLREAVGIDDGRAMPTTQLPEVPSLPRANREALAESVRAHPRVQHFAYGAEAEEQAARVETARRYPSFTLGADWIIVGDAEPASLKNSGMDAVVVGGGIRVPLWPGGYKDSVRAAHAEAQAQRDEQRVVTQRAMAELEAALAGVRDAVRRVRVYAGTLLPQAESAYASNLGGYSSGRGSVAQMLLAQRDLLDLRIELERAHADYARAWAGLEHVAGQEIPAAPSETAARGSSLDGSQPLAGDGSDHE